MFFHILKRDLKRKKTMNIILLLFIIIASMFMASSIPNIITVINGTESYLNKAGIGDYIVVNSGANSISEMQSVLSDKGIYDKCRQEEIIFVTDKAILKDGKYLDARSTNFIQCIEKMETKLLYNDGEPLTALKPGEITVSRLFANNNNLKKGDKLTLEFGGVTEEFTYIGYFKDALFGTPMMGNSRFVISEQDYNKFYEADINKDKWVGKIYNIDTKDVATFKSKLSHVDGIMFDGDRSMINMCYIMEMIVAAIVLIIGIVLIIISFVVLKFMINFTISEEFREIGVMKAIGLKNSKIRGLYVVKYIAFAIVGSCIGLILSIPFGKLLLDVATANMVLSIEGGVILNIAGAILVVLVTIAYAYGCTNIIKKSSPIDAIRNGQTGERYNKKKGYRLGKSHISPSGYMAINDLLSAPKRYLTIIIAFTLCCLLTLIIGNTTATMKSGKLIHLFSIMDCDLFVNQSERIYEVMSETKTLDEALEEFSAEIKGLGYSNEVTVERQYKYMVTSKGKEYSLTCQQGYRNKASDYKYTKGTAPKAADEIAITKVIANLIDAKIGDTVVFDTSDGKKECIITAYFESMNNMGSIIRVHEDFKGDNAHLSGLFSFQVTFTDNPSEKELSERQEVIKKHFDVDQVQTSKEYAEEAIGVVETLDAVEMFLLLVMSIVIIFTTILMESSFISNEKGEIAMLKAIGFSEGSVIGWQVKRFSLVSLVSVVLAIILSIPATRLTITPIFKMMGAETIDYTFDYIKVFVVYPLIVLVITVLFTFVTALKTKSIKAYDTANIE